MIDSQRITGEHEGGTHRAEGELGCRWCLRRNYVAMQDWQKSAEDWRDQQYAQRRRADNAEEALRVLDRAIGSMPDAGFAIDMPARSDYAGERVPNPRWKWWDELALVRRSVHGLLDAQNTASAGMPAEGAKE